MFWKVAGFSQPSPIEQILDKDEFTLEELLDEDDIIQECKSLNGRLVAFLRERSTVEQLVRYLIDPPLDADDPKRAYKYPFTSCEVFCCEVEAIFNTLLEDADLMHLLFSLLEAPAPLSSKTAGYFGRVVGQLLLRKTHEVMQYLQEHPVLLERLVQHVDTTSIAEIIKRLVGADEQSSVLFLAQYVTWLADTPLCDLLLANLASSSSAEAQANAADILTAIAHTQPSALANKLAQPQSVSALFVHANAPGQQVLVPVLEVCIALIEPRRSVQAMEEAPMQDAVHKAKAEAVATIVQYVPSLVQLLQTDPNTPSQPTDGPWVLPMPYGLLSPPLGRARLKAVELLAALLRSGSPEVESAVVQADAVKHCLHLFSSYPFNNMLHSYVVGVLLAILTKGSSGMLKHLFEDCAMLDWLINLPEDIRPPANPGSEEVAAAKNLIRAGYMGHVTQIASTLESFAAHGAEGQGEEGQRAAEGSDTQPAGTAPPPPPPEYGSAAAYMERNEAWQRWLKSTLAPRQDLEDTSRWACGRPTATELGGLDSDGDEFHTEMELVGMQPVLYHRYPDDDHEEDDGDDDHTHSMLKGGGYGAQAVTDALGNIDLDDSSTWGPAHDDDDDQPTQQYSGQERDLVPFDTSQGFGDDAWLAPNAVDNPFRNMFTQGSNSNRATALEDDEVLFDEEEQLREEGVAEAGMTQEPNPDSMAASPPGNTGPPLAPTEEPGTGPDSMAWQPGTPADAPQ